MILGVGLRMSLGNVCGEGIIVWINKGKGVGCIFYEVLISILILKYFSCFESMNLFF